MSPPSDGTRSRVEEPGHVAIERRFVPESYSRGDGLNFQIGRLQQADGMSHAMLRDVRAYAHTIVLPELTGHAPNRRTEHARKAIQRDPLFGVRVQVRPDANGKWRVRGTPHISPRITLTAV